MRNKAALTLNPSPRGRGTLNGESKQGLTPLLPREKGPGDEGGLRPWHKLPPLSWLLSLLLSIGLASCQGPPPPQGPIAQVQQINSGHSIEVTLPGPQSNQLQRVRLLGIIAPDLGQQPWGLDAKRYVSKQLQGQSVLLEFDVEQQDSLKRLRAYVWINNHLLNEDLVTQGLVLAESHLPNTRYETRLRRAQESARLQGLGIWNPDRPLRLHPDQYRKLKLGVQSPPQPFTPAVPTEPIPARPIAQPTPNRPTPNR